MEEVNERRRKLMSRDLVALKKVVELLPIEGADNIELARVENTGWKLVVPKGDFKVGDIGILFEIDSAIEACDQLGFLGKPRKYPCPAKQCEVSVYVIKTKMLRGVVSQGLLVKPELFGLPQTASYNPSQLAQILHVHHVDTLVAAKGSNGITPTKLPWFVPHTDQQRIDANLSLFDTEQEREFCVEEKADGSSMSVFYVDKSFYADRFGVTSHNNLLRRNKISWLEEFRHEHGGSIRLSDLGALVVAGIKHLLHRDKVRYAYTDNMFVSTALKLNLEVIMERAHRLTGRNLVYQGELVGPGIQGNRNSHSGRHWLLFDIYDIDKQRYMLPEERMTFYWEYLYPHVEAVKCISRHRTVLSEFTNADAMQQLANVQTAKGNMAEGVVVKSESYPYVSFKCVSREYLLRGGHRDNRK